ncbi:MULTISPECIES: EAL domain-containing protein [unclassified Duganella]|uniref:EAL domain-containing protein n=1 Tax=unclassified Duganella TaxID=2636909 RepID=UPI00088B56C3|nr:MULTISPECIES: EAL domain-containing protein [unclassified Duganella]SDF57982.1 diguanylate cyclase (GGDEF) domain-containing protein [Duganella sp. OV458]SDI70567.1 diguanylate cyclase (GGDEF) domain-containing protein [Duganella sp. OV510]
MNTLDALTGLADRAAFREGLRAALQRATRTGTQVALVLVNLDGFQAINDLHGQDSGDALLREMASRVLQLARAGEMAARLGGDEFAIVCEQVTAPAALAALAQRIGLAVQAPVAIDGEKVLVTASIGIATASDVSTAVAGDPGDELLRFAAAAVQVARDAGGNGWRFFDPQLHDRAMQRMDLSHGLQLALERNEMAPRFQPIVDAGSGRIVGAELLLRWFPQQGEVSPAEFIPIAEANGAVIGIGAWVFRQACLAERDWHARWGAKAPYVSVNVSVRQLDDAGLADSFAAILRDTGADPQRLLLEITESMLMDDIVAKLRVLDQLSALGLRMAMDDFGTGYSSLAQLARLPVQVLKIDRSFINDIAESGESRAVVEAIISLGRALGLRLVAEGVETAAQQLELCGYGCDYIQGYYFYRPMPAEQLVAAVDKQAALGELPQPGGLYFLLYVSESVAPLSQRQLDQLLLRTRANNAEAGITGCLLYEDEHFMQILEGERSQVLDTFERIRASKLHARVRVVIEGPARRRVFTHWSMLLPDSTAARRHGPDFRAWQTHPMRFDSLADDARVCYAFITAYVPDVKH